MPHYMPKENDCKFDKVAEELAQLRKWQEEDPDNATAYQADIDHIEANIKFQLCIDGYPTNEYETWDEAKNGYDDWMYFNRVNYERYGVRATIERTYE